MKNGRIYLIVLAVVLASVFYSALSKAETLNRNPQDPFMKEGEIFAVKIVPGAKKMEVVITGREVANLKFTELGLSASMKIGNRTFALEPRRKEKGFELLAPEGSQAYGADSRLLLKVQYGEKDEKFEFNMNPK